MYDLMTQYSQLFFYFVIAQTLTDGGAYYAETNPAYLIVEPWNAVSSLSFWIPVFYWAYRLKGKYHRFAFLAFCMPLLFLGGLGSALFHGFRSSHWLLLMDVLPILVLTAAVGIYFWYEVFKNWWYVIALFLVYALLQRWLWSHSLGGQAINITYFLRGIVIFLPAVLLLRKTNFHYVSVLLWAMTWFGLALTFRYFDFAATSLMYMGSHWLWHVSTAIGSHYLALFLYQYVRWQENQASFQEKYSIPKVN